MTLANFPVSITDNRAADAVEPLRLQIGSPYGLQLTGKMPAKSRFTRLDAFAKTVEDARIRTNSGGVITIASLLIVLWLVWGEWADYRRVVVQPELVVDKSRGTRLSGTSGQRVMSLRIKRLTLGDI